MDFDYCTYFGAEHSTGYERLLRDCMAGGSHAVSGAPTWSRAGLET